MIGSFGSGPTHYLVAKNRTKMIFQPSEVLLGLNSELKVINPKRIAGTISPI